MAVTNGQSAPDLKGELLAHGRQFSFFQALRLLNHLIQARQRVADAGTPGAELAEVRVRPDLSMAFPASDIAGIEELPAGLGFQVTATFFGLYGVSSPLPAFYTEDLFRDAREDSSAARDFIDILHRRLYWLLFEGWKKHRLFVQVAEGKNTKYLNMLYAISGLAGSDNGRVDDDSYALIRYTGLLGGHPRSALALQTMLADLLGGVPVDIISCVPRPVKIVAEQRLRLGSDDNPLGNNSFIGEELVDAQGKFRVRIGPLEQPRFRSLLPGGGEGTKISRLIKRFLTDPLDYDLEVVLAKGETQQTTLGGAQWSRLGLDTMVFAGGYVGELSVIFPPG